MPTPPTEEACTLRARQGVRLEEGNGGDGRGGAAVCSPKFATTHTALGPATSSTHSTSVCVPSPRTLPARVELWDSSETGVSETPWRSSATSSRRRRSSSWKIGCRGAPGSGCLQRLSSSVQRALGTRSATHLLAVFANEVGAQGMLRDLQEKAVALLRHSLAQRVSFVTAERVALPGRQLAEWAHS